MTSRRSSPGLSRLPEPRFLLALAFIAPYLVGFAPDSTSAYSETVIGIGAGQYVYHDCSGAHAGKVSDAGVSLTKKFEAPFRIGIAGGAVSLGNRGASLYVFPDLALEWDRFSVGTTGLRIGSRKELFLDVRALDMPFIAGGGALRAGIGFPLNDRGHRLWIGSNVIPYNNAGLALRWEFPFGDGTDVLLNGRFGNDSGIDEYGVSVGFRFTAQ